MQHILKKLKMLLPKASKYYWWNDYQEFQIYNSQLRLDFPDELESYNKIIRVIKSCINYKQLRAASIWRINFIGYIVTELQLNH